MRAIRCGASRTVFHPVDQPLSPCVPPTNPMIGAQRGRTPRAVAPQEASRLRLSRTVKSTPCRMCDSPYHASTLEILSTSRIIKPPTPELVLEVPM